MLIFTRKKGFTIDEKAVILALGKIFALWRSSARAGAAVSLPSGRKKALNEELKP
jgi:hypothetical protein